MTAEEYDARDGDNADREELCHDCDLPESKCVCGIEDEPEPDEDQGPYDLEDSGDGQRRPL